ncbi:MAG TPA: ATPase domain-containing protein [Candidatus Polarisedimenticolaceae bacterium]|nr:ATPase domain-containing protein [Candidatus Polarisedimenticolaceae bacterium]
MHRKELNERSPLRVLDQSIHGGLGRGNIGVVIARHGVGKTAFLVGVALDDLMRGRNVLHVSLEQNADKVRTYYDEIFAELCHTERLEDVWTVRLSLERHRRIHSYLSGTFTLAKLHDALEFMGRDGQFVPHTLVIDGYDLGSATTADLAGLREIARQFDVEMWMSAVTSRGSGRNQRGIPEPVAHYEDAFDVVLTMAHDGKAVHVGLHKDHDNREVPELKLALDPTTMLLIRE